MDKKIFKDIKQHLKKSGLITTLIAVSFTLTLFIRFLDFFITPTLIKIIVFVTLCAFFFFVSSFFIQPILDYLFARVKLSIFLVVASGLAISLLFIILPYRNVPFRTNHRLEVSVPSDSTRVVMEALSDAAGNPIPVDEVVPGIETEDDDIFISPGDAIIYQRQMTGNLIFNLTAVDNPGQVIVTWDGEQEVMDLEAGETRVVETNPFSWGFPSKLMTLFMIAVALNEWFSLVTVVVLFLGRLKIFIAGSDWKYRVNFPELAHFLADYLIINGILVSLVLLERFLKIPNIEVSLLVVLPGFIFLVLKIIHNYFPVLPLIVLSATVLFNILAYSSWINVPIMRPYYEKTPTFNRLAVRVDPDEPTLLSVGYYRELRGAELILPAESEFTGDYYQRRLILINQLRNLFVEDYSGELSYEEYTALVEKAEWHKWDKRTSGSFYFLDMESTPGSPIAFYFYENDVFLVPIEFSKELGLFHDFDFD